MSKTIIHNIDEFIERKGTELGVSEWFEVSQEVINNFADATRDHQWIHVDTNKAATDSPYGSTIAHGYLTLSLLPSFLDEIIEVHNLKQLVNYGIKDFTFKNAVKVGSRLRMRASVKSAKDLGNICQATITCTFEVEGLEEPVAEGNIIFLYYFDYNTALN